MSKDKSTCQGGSMLFKKSFAAAIQRKDEHQCRKKPKPSQEINVASSNDIDISSNSQDICAKDKLRDFRQRSKRQSSTEQTHRFKSTRSSGIRLPSGHCSSNDGHSKQSARDSVLESVTFNNSNFESKSDFEVEQQCKREPETLFYFGSKSYLEGKPDNGKKSEAHSNFETKSNGKSEKSCKRKPLMHSNFNIKSSVEPAEDQERKLQNHEKKLEAHSDFETKSDVKSEKSCKRNSNLNIKSSVEPAEDQERKPFKHTNMESKSNVEIDRNCRMKRQTCNKMGSKSDNDVIKDSASIPPLVQQKIPTSIRIGKARLKYDRSKDPSLSHTNESKMLEGKSSLTSEGNDPSHLEIIEESIPSSLKSIDRLSSNIIDMNHEPENKDISSNGGKSPSGLETVKTITSCNSSHKEVSSRKDTPLEKIRKMYKQFEERDNDSSNSDSRQLCQNSMNDIPIDSDLPNKLTDTYAFGTMEPEVTESSRRTCDIGKKVKDTGMSKYYKERDSDNKSSDLIQCCLKDMTDTSVSNKYPDNDSNEIEPGMAEFSKRTNDMDEEEPKKSLLMFKKKNINQDFSEYIADPKAEACNVDNNVCKLESAVKNLSISKSPQMIHDNGIPDLPQKESTFDLHENNQLPISEMLDDHFFTPRSSRLEDSKSSHENQYTRVSSEFGLSPEMEVFSQPESDPSDLGRDEHMESHSNRNFPNPSCEYIGDGNHFSNQDMYDGYKDHVPIQQNHHGYSGFQPRRYMSYSQAYAGYSYNPIILPLCSLGPRELIDRIMAYVFHCSQKSRDYVDDCHGYCSAPLEVVVSVRESQPTIMPPYYRSDAHVLQGAYHQVYHPFTPVPQCGGPVSQNLYPQGGQNSYSMPSHPTVASQNPHSSRQGTFDHNGEPPKKPQVRDIILQEGAALSLDQEGVPEYNLNRVQLRENEKGESSDDESHYSTANSQEGDFPSKTQSTDFVNNWNKEETATEKKMDAKGEKSCYISGKINCSVMESNKMSAYDAPPKRRKYENVNSMSNFLTVEHLNNDWKPPSSTPSVTQKHWNRQSSTPSPVTEKPWKTQHSTPSPVTKKPWKTQLSTPSPVTEKPWLSTPSPVTENHPKRGLHSIEDRKSFPLTSPSSTPSKLSRKRSNSSLHEYHGIPLEERKSVEASNGNTSWNSDPTPSLNSTCGSIYFSPPSLLDESVLTYEHERKLNNQVDQNRKQGSRSYFIESDKRPSFSSTSCDASPVATPPTPRSRQCQLSTSSRDSLSTVSPFNSFRRRSFETYDRWKVSFLLRSRSYNYKFIDTHCHIDFLYNRINSPVIPFKEFREKNSDSFPANYEGCVSVFCHPRTFYKYTPEGNDILNVVAQEEGVWIAAGCHPKNAKDFRDEHARGLVKILTQCPKVVALGEIGLDYSGTFKQYEEVQKQVFRRQLMIALNLKLPIVIHCRDADDDCLAILQEIVPRNHKIHAHCFTRNLKMAHRWMYLFPNLYLGLTPVITYRSAVEAIDTAAGIPLERLLLETDAPYFLPAGAHLSHADEKFSHPGLALYTAEQVAHLRNIPVDDVLKAARENTRIVYGI